MSYRYEADVLHCERTPLPGIARETGTPVYVYSSADIAGRYRAYNDAFGDLPHAVCYAVKANSNLSVLRLLAGEGAGFDIVSGGELHRVLEAGGDPRRVVFSGVGKTAEEIDFALCRGIHTFNCESEAELELIDAIAARAGRKARIALRVNPDVDASTHPYISTGLRDHKFGIDIAGVEAVYARAAQLPNLVPEGVSCHIGSQLLDVKPMLESVAKMMALVERLRGAGFPIRHLDLGGGLGVAYRAGDTAPSIADLIGGIRRHAEGKDLQVMVEPGRSIVGEAGVLLTRVLLRKRTATKEFVVVDAAMNDLLRPALYGAWHDVKPVRATESTGAPAVYDVVGPVCESADFLAKERRLVARQGDFLALMSAGAYSAAMSSNYNTRPRAAEVLVEGATCRLVRRRETVEELFALERFPA